MWRISDFSKVFRKHDVVTFIFQTSFYLFDMRTENSDFVAKWHGFVFVDGNLKQTKSVSLLITGHLENGHQKQQLLSDSVDPFHCPSGQ